jgi:hypothetical protein
VCSSDLDEVSRYEEFITAARRKIEEPAVGPSESSPKKQLLARKLRT